MRGTRSNVRFSRIALTGLFAGVLVLLGASSAFAQWTVTPSASGGGTISPNTAQTVANNGNVTFTFAPASGYQVAEVIIDGVTLTDTPAPAGDLDGTGHRILTYTFSNVVANHTIYCQFEPLFTLIIGPAGPDDYPMAIATPAANEYVVAGAPTTSPATGIYYEQYKYGDTLSVSVGTVSQDYKFGEWRSGTTDANGFPEMTQQKHIYATQGDDTDGDDLYWLFSSPTGKSVGALQGSGMPQSLLVTIKEDQTQVTSWFVRANIMQEVTGPAETPEPGDLFQPLDSGKLVGLAYDGYHKQVLGVVVQLQFEDTFPVQQGQGYAITPGAGDQIDVDIAPNTGTPGAYLFQPVTNNDTPGFVTLPNELYGTPGVTQFGKMQISMIGDQYQLEYKYYMNRATVLGAAFRAIPEQVGMPAVPTAVPILYSETFQVPTMATAHYAVGYNYFGQLGNGLVTPDSLTETAPLCTGLPQPNSWVRTSPPPDPGYTLGLQPYMGVTNGNTISWPGEAAAGPCGVMGVLFEPYPHWFEQVGFTHDYSGWVTQLMIYPTEWQWQSRTYAYPADEFAQGRDHYEPVQCWHTYLCPAWESYQQAFNSVSAGQMTSYALRDTGILWTFGDDTYGQCCQGPSGTPTYTQAPPDGPANFKAYADPQVAAGFPRQGNCSWIAAGFQHAIAVDGAGNVWSWGRNNEGQLGLGTTDDQVGGHPSATQIPGLSNVVSVASGDYFSFALELNGSVWGWGNNADGELGDGTRNTRNTPEQIPGLGLTLFSGHTAAILGVATSPDGQYVLTCSADDTARLSNVTTGALVRTIASSGPYAHTGPINAVAFSPDGTKIVTASADCTAKLWTVNGTYLTTFVDTTIGTTYTHKGSVTSVAFSPDGNYVVTGSVDNTAKVWSTAFPTYSLVSTCTGSTLGINGVAFSANFPTYDRIYTAAGDETVKIYDAMTGTLERNFNGTGATAHSNAVTSIAVMNNSGDDYVVTGSTDCTAKLWIVPSGSDLESLDFTFDSMFDGNTSGHYAAVMSVAITQDQNTGYMYILTGSQDQYVKRWSNSSGSWAQDESYRRHTDWVNGVAFGYTAGSLGVQNENLIVTGSNDLSAVLSTTPIVTAIAAGTSHTLFLREDGTVLACGYNGFGQCGQGDSGAMNYLSPTQVVDPYDPTGFLQNAYGVSAGNEHSVALINSTTEDGYIYCWGSNTYGELAQGPGTAGSPPYSTTPLVAVDETRTPISGMQAVSAGWGYTVAHGNGIYAWGHNNHGQLGIDGPNVDANTLLTGPSDAGSSSPGSSWPYATPWTSNVAPGGGDAPGNSPMTTLSARYWHTQYVEVDGTWHRMTINVDPPNAGVILPDNTGTGFTQGRNSQTGQPGAAVFFGNNATSSYEQSESGTSIFLYAIPRPGYTFDHYDGYAPSQTYQTSWMYNNIAETNTNTPLTTTGHFIAVPRQWQLTLNTNPATAVATGAGTYNDSEVATLTAYNNANYTFDHWSGDPSIENSRLNPTYIRMNGSKTITANFVAATPIQYTLTVQCSPPSGGSISDITSNPAVPLTNGNAYTYLQGTVVLLEATPGPGFVFSNWAELDGANPDQLSSTTTQNTALPMTSTVTSKSLTAYFTVSNQTYALTTQALLNNQASSVGGTVSPANGGTYAVNTLVTVQATPSAGYSFAGWSSNVTPNSLNPLMGTVLLNQAQLVQANFTQGSLPLTVQSLPFSGVGIYSPTGHGGTTNYAIAVNGNIPVTLTAPATQNNGGTTYYFAYWTLNGYAEPQGATTLSFVMGPSEIALANYQLDTTAPTVTQELPAIGSVQNPPNTIVQLQVTDLQSGVNLSTVKVQVEGDLVYDGSLDTTTGSVGTDNTVYGLATRTGNTNDYTISFDPSTPFHLNQVVNVTVNASDNAGNAMTPFNYTFTVQMRGFGQNIRANSNGDAASHHPTTGRDASGNQWVAWESSDMNVWLGERPAGATTFSTSTALESGGHNRELPSLAVSPVGGMYVIWQDYRNGYWELYGYSTPNGINGAEFPTGAFVHTGANQTSPAAAVDHNGRIYVVWQDAHNGPNNIYVSYSSNGGLTWASPAAISAQPTVQSQPSIAIDAANNVYVVWSDARNEGSGHGLDIFGASSSNGINWTVAQIVGNAHNHTAPVVATESTGTILHFAWVGDETGDDDIYYASTGGGLPASSILGTDIIDDTADVQPHVAPAIAVTGSASAADVFITWQDGRNIVNNNGDTDIYFCEVWAGTPGTNVLVNDDTTTAAQSNPCVGVDASGQAYMAWEDDRVTGRMDIWYAATTYPSPNNFVQQALALPGPYALVSLANAATVQVNQLPLNIFLNISAVLNPPAPPSPAVGGVYMIGPGNLTFSSPATVTIYFNPSVTPVYPAYQAYWFDYTTGLWLTDGIGTASENSTSSTITFTVSHFSMYSVQGLGTPGSSPGTTTGSGSNSGSGTNSGSSSASGGGGGGGCFIATSAYEAEAPALSGLVEVNCTGRYLISPERLQKLNDIREIRDSLLLRVPEGREFSAWYYAVGPYAANAIRDNVSAKAAVRTLILNPLSALSRTCGAGPQSK